MVCSLNLRISGIRVQRPTRSEESMNLGAILTLTKVASRSMYWITTEVELQLLTVGCFHMVWFTANQKGSERLSFFHTVPVIFPKRFSTNAYYDEQMFMVCKQQMCFTTYFNSFLEISPTSSFTTSCSSSKPNDWLNVFINCSLAFFRLKERKAQCIVTDKVTIKEEFLIEETPLTQIVRNQIFQYQKPTVVITNTGSSYQCIQMFLGHWKELD